MGLSKSMDVFGSTFNKESSQLKEIEKKYQSDISNVGDSKTKQASVARGYQDSVRKVTNSIMRKDANLRLRFPFKLSDTVKRKLESHPSYYENDGVITKVYGGSCIQCGKKIHAGVLYVEDNKSGVNCCLVCANPNLDIDGESYKIKTGS